MKKQLFRLITVVLLVVLVLAMAQVAVYAKEKSEISLLKTSEESYIIYVKDILNTDFLFSFSDDLETAEEDLIFSASGLDSNESNIAYMTKEQAESLNNAKTYMWVNINEEIQTYEINLNEAITVEEIAFVNTTTKRIQANAVGEENVSQYLEGVKITHSQGKINITEQGNAFSYHMVKVSDSETTKLPVTFDSIITLIIIFVVLVALIIALIVAKKKLNKKED